ncbi:MAG: DEAD/DEAH box helicase family protein [Myxococcota bacterium]
MRLLFDQGTLVLAEAPDISLDFVPGLIWDPRVALYRAPAHYYGEVVDALRERGIAFRDDLAFQLGATTGSWSSRELRPYQHAALLSWELAQRRGILVMPTGSGKTRVAIAAMSRTRSPTLCVVPTRALLEQWLLELRAAQPGPVGRLGDGHCEYGTITVATFESAYRHISRIGANFELLVVDEVHHFGNAARDEILQLCCARHRLGLTATPPDRRTLARLDQLIGPVCFQLRVADLAGTWLADFDRVVLRVPLARDERERYGRDRSLFGEVSRAFWSLHPGARWSDFVAAATRTREGRAALAAWRRNRSLSGFTRAKASALRELLARHRDSRVLVFTADNDAAYAIARSELIMPITCETARVERERALRAFREGELQALVSARVLNEGIDVPAADVAIIVGSAQGEREYVQRIGRLLRPAPGKRATVYELVSVGTDEVQRARRRGRGLAADRVV